MLKILDTFKKNHVMMTNTEYFKLFYTIVSDMDDKNVNQAAFEETERVHFGTYGCHKYFNYGAFRTAKTRHIRSLSVRNRRLLRG